MVKLIRVEYELRGECHTAVLTKGEAALVVAALTARYPGLRIDQVEVVK
jgi:hypothetical protein